MLDSLTAAKAQPGSMWPGVVHVGKPTGLRPVSCPSSPQPGLNNNGVSYHSKH